MVERFVLLRHTGTQLVSDRALDREEGFVSATTAFVVGRVVTLRRVDDMRASRFFRDCAVATRSRVLFSGKHVVSQRWRNKGQQKRIGLFDIFSLLERPNWTFGHIVKTKIAARFEAFCFGRNRIRSA